MVGIPSKSVHKRCTDHHSLHVANQLYYVDLHSFCISTCLTYITYHTHTHTHTHTHPTSFCIWTESCWKIQSDAFDIAAIFWDKALYTTSLLFESNFYIRWLILEEINFGMHIKTLDNIAWWGMSADTASVISEWATMGT